MKICRLAILYHVRRIKKDIRDSDFNTIESLRNELKLLLDKLGRLQATAKVTTRAAPHPPAEQEMSHGGRLLLLPRRPRGAANIGRVGQPSVQPAGA